jgi:hypothetical protein
VGTVGLGITILWRDKRASLGAEALVVSGAWFVLLFASLVRYMTTTPSAEGRLLFPGIASLAVFLILGWNAVVPRRWQPVAVGVAGSGLLVLAVASPLLAIAPRYAQPLVEARHLPTNLAPVRETWRGVRLLGVEVEPETFATGTVVRVAAYWRAESTPEKGWRAVVQIWSAGGRLLGQSDQVPAGESYPPDLWQSGDIVRDVHKIRVTDPGPAACRVMVTLREGNSILGKQTTPLLCKLSPSLPPAIQEPENGAYRFGDFASLIDIDLSNSVDPEKGELSVALLWRVLSETEQAYTVFVHLVGPDGHVLGQGDGPPVQGDYPTTVWSPGETLVDTHGIPLQGPPPAGSYLLVGLYRLKDGVRLPAYTHTGGRVRDDAVRLDLE